MPGLAGWIGAVGSGDISSIIAGLTGPADRAVTRAASGAVFAHAALPVATDQGGVLESDGLLVVAHGWIAGLGRPTTVQGSPLARHCLEIYRRDGAPALAVQNGVYAVAIWDGTASRLTLAHDRLGLGGLAYRVDGESLTFGSRTGVLEHADDAIDAAALGQVLSVGYPLGDRSLVGAVRVLGPGTIARFENGCLLLKRVWEPPVRVGGGADGLEMGDAIDALDGALDDAVADATADLGDTRVALPLSGGLDSRVILGYARRHSSPTTVSYGHGHCWDRKFGKELALVASVRHRAVRLRPDYMLHYGPRLVHLTSGRATLHAAHILALNPELARRPSVALSGFLGDTLTGGHLGWVDLPGTRAADVGAAGAGLFGRAYKVAFDDAGLGNLLRPGVRSEAVGAAREAFLATYRTGYDPVSRADRVDLELRQHRFVSYQLDVLGEVAPVRVPFADARVLDVCMRLPVELRVGQALYRRLIIDRHADLARVPEASTGLAMAGPGLALAVRRAVEYTRWRLIPRWTRGLIRPHDYRQYAHYDDWIRSDSRPLFTELFESVPEADAIFDMGRLRDLLAAHVEHRIDAFQSLSAAATVIEWLRARAMRDAVPAAALDRDQVTQT